MEPSDRWWTRRPRASAAGLVIVAVALALGAAIVGVTAAVRLPARGTTCDATTASAQIFPSLVAIGPPGSEHRFTGTVVRGNGIILTSATAAPSGTATVPVTLSDGETLSATVVGTDAPSALAVLRIDRKQLPFLLLSPKEPARAGLPVLVLGSPNSPGSAVLAGTVQKVDATVELQGMPGEQLRGATTTDLPGPEANTGAPLVTCDYRVIGVVVGRTADGATIAASATTAAGVLSRLLGMS